MLCCLWYQQHFIKKDSSESGKQFNIYLSTFRRMSVSIFPLLVGWPAAFL